MLTKATYSKVIGLLNMKITYQIKYKKHPAKTKRFLTTHFKHFISKAITKFFLAFSVEVFQSFQKLCTILGSLVQIYKYRDRRLKNARSYELTNKITLCTAEFHVKSVKIFFFLFVDSIMTIYGMYFHLNLFPSNNRRRLFLLSAFRHILTSIILR